MNRISTRAVEEMVGAHPVESEWAMREGVVSADRTWDVDEVVEFVMWLVWHRLSSMVDVDGVEVVFHRGEIERGVLNAWPEELAG